MLKNLELLGGLTIVGEDKGDQEGRLTSIERWVVELGTGAIKESTSTEELFEKMEEEIMEKGKSSLLLTKLKEAIYISDDFYEQDNIGKPQFVKKIDDAAIIKAVDFEKADTSEYYSMDQHIKEYLNTFNIFNGTPVFFRVYDHDTCMTKLDACLLVMGDLDTVYMVLSHIEQTFRSNNPLYSRRQEEYEKLRTVNECPSDELIEDIYETLKGYPSSEVIDITNLIHYADYLNGGEIYRINTNNDEEGE